LVRILKNYGTYIIVESVLEKQIRTKYSLQVSDLRIHLLAEDVPCVQFKYTNIENIVMVQICR
jgi:hypothetical protein